MSLDTYANLQTSIAGWLNRSDLTSVIPDFVVMAEEIFSNTLRVRQMESTTTDTMSSSAITLPSDFRGFRSIRISSSPDYVLEYYTPEQVAAFDQAETGIPRGYKIEGSTVTFFPTADADYTVEYTYYKAIPDLATNSTNWLLTAAPGAYLHGSLMQAYVYLQNDAFAAREEKLMNNSLAKVISSDADDRWSGATLRVRTV